MFERARWKLTAWYLLIIMAVSLSFSGVIYRGVTREFQLRLNLIEGRLELRRFGLRPPLGQTQFFIQDLEETRQRVLVMLAYINLVILVFSAMAGYFLAGRTLEPIEVALEEQKRFVADASHELKTPLTALQTAIEVALRDKKLELSGAKKVLRESLADLGGLRRLANDLLSLARYQQVGQNFKPEKVNVGEMLNDARRKIEPLAKEKGVKVEIDNEQVWVQADREGLEKIITILLDNAVKYTQKGGRVSAKIKKSRGRLALEVADTGVGIEAGVVERIFDRFYRGETSRSKNQTPGFGLGLAIAKRIAEVHGWTIEVTSIPAAGSVFKVRMGGGF